MADRNLDDYQPLAFYKKHTKAKQSGFSRFDVDGAYYFCRHVDGEIALISQSYKAAAGRDNGIDSVKKNSKIKERYVFDTRPGKKFGFSLLAGNKQEIAISPSYGRKQKAEFVAGRMDGSVRAKSKVDKAPSAMQSVAKGQSFTQHDNRIENYKPLNFYKINGSDLKDGFDSFEKEGAYYFSYRQDGDIVLISESYTSAKGRDNGVESVITNMKLKERYQHHAHKNGKHYFDINAANHQEIATSRWYGRNKGALAAAAKLRGENLPKPREISRPANTEDDYKPLAFFERQTKGKKEGVESFEADDGLYYFAVFENNKIALISEGYPTSAARDAGVASVEKNIKLDDRYEYRGPLKNGMYDYRLKAGNHKEIARSVWYGSAAAAATGAAYLMGTRKRFEPASKDEVAVVEPIVEAPESVTAAALAESAAVPDSVPKAASEPEIGAWSYETESKGIWGWLRWLLLALLALLALFFLFKACTGPDKTAVAPIAAKMVACWDGSEAINQANCPVKITCWDGSTAKSEAACPVQTFACWDGSSVTDINNCPVEPAPEPVVEVEPMPEPEPVIVEPVRTVAAMTGLATIFSPGGDEAVLVKRLGTNPQFGDSHSLTPEGFCGLLGTRYATSSYDAGYLNYIAREMGYGGFNDIPTSACSNATIANGSRGMLGYGSQHAYQYSELNMTDLRDLEAFRIQSLNGKDIYFMKTCGNYFYITG